MAIKIEHHIINKDDDNIRVDRWFKRHFGDVSFTVVAKFIRKGQVRLNSKRVEINTRLQADDQLRFPDLTPYKVTEDQIRGTNPFKLERLAKELEQDIIFKNEDFIVINKPYNLASQDGTKTNVSVDSISQYWQFNGEQKPKLVHRLDKETTGLMILARSSAVAASLSDMMRKRQVEKIYFAVLQGVPKPAKGKIDIPISKERNVSFERVTPNKHADRAITEYEMIDNVSDVVSTVRMKLITGRTHQLRVHSAAIECPIVGDSKYNTQPVQRRIRNIEHKLHLHSHIIRFTFKGKDYEFTAPFPPHIKNTLDMVGL